MPGNRPVQPSQPAVAPAAPVNQYIPPVLPRGVNFAANGKDIAPVMANNNISATEGSTIKPTDSLYRPPARNNLPSAPAAPVVQPSTPKPNIPTIPNTVNLADNPKFSPTMQTGLQGYLKPKYNIDTVAMAEKRKGYMKDGDQDKYPISDFRGTITPRDVLHNTYGDQLDANVAEAKKYNKSNSTGVDLKNLDKPSAIFESPRADTAARTLAGVSPNIININPKDSTAPPMGRLGMLTNHMAEIAPGNLKATNKPDLEALNDPYEGVRHEIGHTLYPPGQTIKMLGSSSASPNKIIAKEYPDLNNKSLLQGYFADAGERATGISTAQQDMFKLTGHRARTPQEFTAFVNKYLNSPDIEESMKELSPNTRRYIRFHVGMPEIQKNDFMHSDAFLAPGFVQNQQQPVGQKIAACRSTGVFDVNGSEYVNSEDVELLGKLGFILDIDEYSALEKTGEVLDQYSYVEKIAGVPKAVVKAIDKGEAFSGEFLKDMDYDVPKGYEMKGDLCCPIEKEKTANEQHKLVHYSNDQFEKLHPLTYEELLKNRTSGRWEKEPDKAKKYVEERKNLEDYLRKRLKQKGILHDKNKTFLYATLDGREQYAQPDRIKHEAPLTPEIINQSFFDVVGLPSRTIFGQKGLDSAIRRWDKNKDNLKTKEYMGMTIRPRIEIMTPTEVATQFAKTAAPLAYHLHKRKQEQSAVQPPIIEKESFEKTAAGMPAHMWKAVQEKNAPMIASAVRRGVETKARNKAARELKRLINIDGSAPAITGAAPWQDMFRFDRSHLFEQLKKTIDPAYVPDRVKYLGKQADDDEQNAMADAHLKRKFKYWANKMRTKGVLAGTYHKRIAIPKARLPEEQIKRLGFIPVAIAIPESGQDTLFSYRHPDNLFHIHSHGNHWTMHEDHNPSMTMALKNAPLREMPAAIANGLSHIVTEGVPGAYKYVSHRLTGAKDMLDAVMSETAEQKKLTHKV